MLKNVPSFVPDSTKFPTYPRGYACGFVFPAASLETFLSILSIEYF